MGADKLFVGKNPLLLIASVAGIFMYSIYFAYMTCLFLLAYCLITVSCLPSRAICGGFRFYWRANLPFASLPASHWSVFRRYRCSSLLPPWAALALCARSPSSRRRISTRVLPVCFWATTRPRTLRCWERFRLLRFWLFLSHGARWMNASDGHGGAGSPCASSVLLLRRLARFSTALVTPRIDGRLFLAFAQRTRLCSWCPHPCSPGASTGRRLTALVTVVAVWALAYAFKEGTPLGVCYSGHVCWHLRSIGPVGLFPSTRCGFLAVFASGFD